MTDVAMPVPWENAEGWEQYYTALYPQGEFREHAGGCGSIGHDITGFAKELQENGWSRIWIPGCGLSALPKALISCGVDVWATDVSPTAIAFQSSRDSDPPTDCGDADKFGSAPGKLTLDVHDFTTPYLTDHFDVVLNVKAFQGFTKATMDAVAATHFQALRSGRQAIFDTTNVQGTFRDDIETALEGAGFVVPFAAAWKAYRRELRESGINHVFILGRPIYPCANHRSEEAIQATEALNAIRSQFEAEIQCARDAESKRCEGAKIATVIYSTG